MGKRERKIKEKQTLGACATGGGGDDEDAASNLMLEPFPPRVGGVQSVIMARKPLFLGKLDSCSSCIRYVLVIGNCIFFFLGCTIIGLGIYVVVDKVNFVTGLFGLTLVAPASYLIIASGCVVFIISFIGCFGALFESRPLLAIYSTALAVVLVLSCVGFMFAVIFRSKVTDQIRVYMRNTLQNDYGVDMDQQWNKFVTDSWNKAQKKWQCCGVRDDTWSIYNSSSWYEKLRRANVDSPIVPASCCRLTSSGSFEDFRACQQGVGESRELPDVNTSAFGRAVNVKGCYEEGKSVMSEIAGYLICIGAITATLVIGGLALSIQLTRNI